MPAQQRRHAADLAPTHGVRLSGEGQRPRARPTDVTGGEVQVDQRDVLVGALHRLVQPLAVERERGRRPGEQACRGHDIVHGKAAQTGDSTRRGFGHRGANLIETAGVIADERVVGEAFPEHHVQHRVQQGDIGAGQQGEMQVGNGGGVGPAWIDHDQLHARIGLARLLDPVKQDRMGAGRVRAGDDDATRLLDVGIARGRGIGTERGLVAHHRRRHAQT